MLANPLTIIPSVRLQCLFLLVMAVFGAGMLNAELIGTWKGEAATETERTRIALNIRSFEKGFQTTMDLLDIGVLGWPALKTKVQGENVLVTFPSDSGPQTMKLTHQGDVLSGTWKESRFKEPAQVELSIQTASSDHLESRVKFPGPAGSIGASIILPKGKGPFPGVIFMHGSGPQPRDSSRFAARTLADSGIVSLIFDKRGVRESEGDYRKASFEDLARDGAAAAEYLDRQESVERVGFFGHSQGGWVAPLAATLWKKSSFVITSAGPAVSPSREGQWDVVRQLRRSGYDEAVEAKARNIIELWHEGVRHGSWKAFDASVKASRNKDWFKEGDFSVFLNRPSSKFAQSYRLYMDYDPLPTLKALRIPMLAIFAPEDESIDSIESMEILANLGAQGLDIRLVSFPRYDHSMRRMAASGTALRFAGHPPDYFSIQAAFIQSLD